MTTLLQDVEAFLSTHPELTKTQFGLRAVNDGHLVRRLEGIGRSRKMRVWPEREAKIRQFMLTYRPPAAK